MKDMTEHVAALTDANDAHAAEHSTAVISTVQRRADDTPSATSAEPSGVAPQSVDWVGDNRGLDLGSR